jgi:glucuronate isomerase
MKSFITDDFLLHNETARELYHDHAAKQPIIDYHCHLPPADIAGDRQFDNIAQMWLEGDHYKWRAMRTNGVEERYITGDGADREKFRAWAATVPATLGNPLYYWTHLELRRPFGIDDLLLSEQTADEVWRRTGEMLAQPEFSTRGILRQMNVQFVCTTDDPADDLRYHREMAEDPELSVKVLPAFRPDKVLGIDQPERLNSYLETLGEAADISITRFQDLLDALEQRLEYFHSLGARISDHALQVPVAADYTLKEVEGIFEKVRGGTAPTQQEVDQYRTAVMEHLGRLYHKHGWVMQLHIGAQRNNNTRMFETLGPDTGFDSMGDGLLAQPLARFLDRLDRTAELPQTIIYILNPRDNELIASLIGCFQDGSVPGKVQFGPAWWFNDQKNGMEWHMTALANMGLLSRFVGMLTDSRSFLSFPRHEYFRRILCGMLGSWVEAGEAPKDMELLGSMVEDICYNNARAYFGLKL